jgi:hypothetical protein
VSYTGFDVKSSEIYVASQPTNEARRRAGEPVNIICSLRQSFSPCLVYRAGRFIDRVPILSKAVAGYICPATFGIDRLHHENPCHNRQEESVRYLDTLAQRREQVWTITSSLLYYRSRVQYCRSDFRETINTIVYLLVSYTPGR